MATDDIPWTGSFRVTTPGESDGPIRVDQIGDEKWRLRSTVTYTGAATGLEKWFPTGSAGDLELRVVTPQHLEPDTDLASVPGPLRWFMNSYGVHTPAALIHDRFIPAEDCDVDGMADQYADRYFRFMLDDLGVPWLRRWLMWAAVALRTRNVCAQPLLIAWVIVAVIGITTAVVGVATWTWWLMLIAVVLPVPAAALWGKQWGASFIAAIGALFVIPPAVVAVAGYAVYLLLERVARLTGRR